MKIVAVQPSSSVPVIFEELFTEGCPEGQLFMRVAQVPGPVRAEVVLTHGLGEHSARYGHVARALGESGFRLWAYDMRAHGRSPGRRGDVPDYDLFLSDLECAIQQVPATDAPIFLMGHSMGAQITLNYLLRRNGRIQGAVIASPWLRLAFRPARWRLALARLALFIWPGFRQPTPKDWTRLSRDIDHLAALPGLELMHHLLSARLYFALTQAGESAIAEAPRLRTPVFLLHGGEDLVTSMEATREFFERAGAADKAFKVYPEARHETHNDLCRDQVLRDIVGWLEARVDGSK